MANIFSRAASAMGFQTSERKSVSPFKEAGSAGYSVYGGYLTTHERRASLVGQNRYITASNLLTNISIVAAGTRYFLNMLAKPSWSFEPADKSDQAKQMAEFMEDAFDNMSTSIPRIVRRGGMYKFHGFGIHEWTAMKRDDGKIGILDIESRPQHTIEKWDVEANGDILGVVQRSPQDGSFAYLPRSKFVYLVDDMMTDSPEGMGWFRHLVDPAERMTEYRRLEATGFLKDLSGLPIGKAPIAEMQALIGHPKPGGGSWTKADIDAAIAGLKNFMEMHAKTTSSSLMLDSSAYEDVTQDGTKTTSVAKWGIDLLTGSADSAPHVGKAIEQLTQDMARIIGVENMLTGANGRGSQALSKDKSENFHLTVNSTLGDMRGAFERDIVDQVWALNGFDDKLKPEIKVEDVAYKDVTELSTMLANMAQAGAVLAPDDPAINDLRDLAGIARAPEIDPGMMGVPKPITPVSTPKPKPNGDGTDMPPNQENAAPN